jgi:hypothetical protein
MDEEQELEDEEEQAPQISLVVGLLATIVFIVLDIFSIVPGVGDIEDIPGVLVLIVSFVSDVGGTILTTESIAIVIKLFPFLQAVPAWTFAWLFIWYAANHPNSAVAGAVKLAAAAKLKSNIGNLEKQAANIEENPNGSVIVKNNEGSQQYTGSAATEKIQEKRELERLSSKRGDALDTLQGTDQDQNQDQDENNEKGQENPIDLETREEKNPLENLGEDIYNPNEDFDNWDNVGSGDKKNEDEDEENEDDELPLAA